MRRKLRLFNLLLIMVLIFSFTACTTPKTATKTAQNTITETTTPEFGFLRNVFDIDQEKIEETGATWFRNSNSLL